MANNTNRIDPRRARRLARRAARAAIALAKAPRKPIGKAYAGDVCLGDVYAVQMRLYGNRITIIGAPQVAK